MWIEGESAGEDPLSRQEDLGSAVFATRLAALRFSASGGLVGRHREVVSFCTVA